MPDTQFCDHLKQAAHREHAAKPSGPGCEECLASGDEWVHLRVCLACGHVGCSRTPPSRHATKHSPHTPPPVIRSYEPGEDWAYCYPHDLGVEVFAAKPGET